MGKVTKFTGSKLLGAELRRLRGGRSLKQIADLSKTPPLSERVAPVAAPTLSQIENGISFPSLETLHALATIYQISVQQLLDLVVQERLASRGGEPETLAAAKELFHRALTEGSGHEALRAAVWAEEAATSPASRVLWRGNRALALQALGLRQDAIRLLLDCISDPEAPRDRLYQLHQSLADVYTDAGYLPSAGLHLSAAAAAAPPGLSPAALSRLVLSRAAHAVTEAELTGEPDAREFRKLVRELEGAIDALPADAEGQRLLARILRAVAQVHSGNRLVGRDELGKLADEARRKRQAHAELTALMQLGQFDLRAGRKAAGRRRLEAAANLALDGDHLVEAFEASFALYEDLADLQVSEARRLLKRCDRLHPLIASRTPSMLRYERVARMG